MDWSMSICVSVYRREFWKRLESGQASKPDWEMMFCEPLYAGYTEEDLKMALKAIVARTERWLNEKKVSLVTHLVVTVYSLEVS